MEDTKREEMTKNLKKYLTMGLLISGDSVNFGRGEGNHIPAKTLHNRYQEVVTYISSQAFKYSLIEAIYQQGHRRVTYNNDEGALQLAKAETVATSIIADLRGFFKTEDSKSTSRKAPVRVSRFVSVTDFLYDTDFQTNGGVAKENGYHANIITSHVDKSYSFGTIGVDLGLIGRSEKTGELVISLEERIERVHALIEAIKIINKDARGLTVNLSPIAIVGGLFEYRNEYFQDALATKGRELYLDILEGILEDPAIAKNTMGAVKKGHFPNQEDYNNLFNQQLKMHEFYEELKTQVEMNYRKFEGEI